MGETKGRVGHLGDTKTTDAGYDQEPDPEPPHPVRCRVPRQGLSLLCHGSTWRSRMGLHRRSSAVLVLLSATAEPREGSAPCKAGSPRLRRGRAKAGFGSCCASSYGSSPPESNTNSLWKVPGHSCPCKRRCYFEMCGCSQESLGPAQGVGWWDLCCPVPNTSLAFGVAFEAKR